MERVTGQRQEDIFTKEKLNFAFRISPSLLNGQLDAKERIGQLCVKMKIGASATFLKCIKNAKGGN